MMMMMMMNFRNGNGETTTAERQRKGGNQALVSYCLSFLVLFVFVLAVLAGFIAYIASQLHC